MRTSTVVLITVLIGACASKAPSTTEVPSETTGPQASEPDPLRPETAAEFARLMPITTCEAVTACSNEEVRAGVLGMFAIMAAFSGAKKPEALEPLKSIEPSPNLQYNYDECMTIVSATMSIGEIEPTSMKTLVEERKTVLYDPDVGQNCLTSIHGSMPQCSEEKTAADEISPMQVAEVFAPYEADFQKVTEPCVGVLKGTVEVGGACTADIECLDGQCKAGVCAAIPQRPVGR